MPRYYLFGGGGRGRENQAYSRLSTTHGHITDCKLDSVVYACELMWTWLVGAERSTPNRFWVPSHRFNSVTGELFYLLVHVYKVSLPAPLVNIHDTVECILKDYKNKATKMWSLATGSVILKCRSCQKCKIC